MSGGVWFPALGLAAWLCCLSLGPVDGGKVLVMPVDGSHWLSMKILVKELSRRGHEVSVLVPESSLLIHSSESYKTEIYQVPYTKADDKFKQLKDGAFLKPPAVTDLFINVERLIYYTSMEVKACESLLNNQPLMSRLKEKGFDLVLTDPFLPCGSILSHLFSIPAVYFLRGMPCELDIKANQCPSPPSFVPKFFSGNTNIMNFPQRVKNMAMSILESYLCGIIYAHFDDAVRKYAGDNMTYKDLLSHAAIWLLRYDFVLEYPRPLMPNVVFIGGINCAKKAPLPAVAVERLLKMKALSLTQPAEGGSAGQGSVAGAMGFRVSSPGLSPPPEPLSEAALGIASHLQAGGAGCPWEEWTPVPLPAMYCELYSFFGDSLAVRFSTGPGFGSYPPCTPSQLADARKDPPGPASNHDTTRKMPQLTANLNISPRQDGSPRTDPPPPSLAATGSGRSMARSSSSSSSSVQRSRSSSSRSGQRSAGLSRDVFPKARFTSPQTGLPVFSFLIGGRQMGRRCQGRRPFQTTFAPTPPLPAIPPRAYAHKLPVIGRVGKPVRRWACSHYSLHLPL